MRSHLLTFALLLACNGDDPGKKPGPADTDTGEAPEPGALQAGFARLRIPAPVGIGTVGYGPFGAPSSDSPFAEMYPATKNIYTHPEIKTAVISRGDGFEMIFIRVDAVGVFQQLRRALVLELQERMGKDLDHAILIGGTHTHSGPGRVIDGGGVYDIIADKFFPEFYEAFVDALADSVEAAYADLAPARIATSAGYSAEGHNDRRCEDGLDYENGTLPFVAIERDGQLETLIAAYAVHGTIYGLGDLTLSQDVYAGIEQAIEDRFDQPVDALVFNAWGADMSPGDPEVPLEAGAGIGDNERRIAEVGWRVAEDVEAALQDLAWEDEPVIQSETHRVPIDREVIGYAGNEFPYPYGGVYCEGGEDDCDPSTTVAGLDQVCVPFNADFPAPMQTEMSAGRLGNLYIVTFPGEPGTLLAEQVMEEIRAQNPEVEDILFLGYAQDYIGYSILEDDWWQGGYEASGALWGPRQGEYLAEKAVSVFGQLTGVADGFEEPEPITPFGDPDYEPYAAETALDFGTVAADVSATYAPTDMVRLEVQGSDPWLGAPLAFLESADGSPVLRANGTPYDSDMLPFHWALSVSPPYEETMEPQERSFAWTLSFPVKHPVPGTFALPAGEYRLRVQLPTEGGVEEILSSPFTVTE